jgi:hypothetical protein
MRIRACALSSIPCPACASCAADYQTVKLLLMHGAEPGGPNPDLAEEGGHGISATFRDGNGVHRRRNPWERGSPRYYAHMNQVLAM